MSNQLVVEQAENKRGVYWCYPVDILPAFNAIAFDESQLAAAGCIEGQAVAGRGNTFFFRLENSPLVLRHYRRGGMIRKVVSKRYCYTGLSRTRAMCEMRILIELQKNHLPAPVPYAAQISVHGLSYEASLVTHQLAGNTLAERLLSESVSDDDWANMGNTIAQFHHHGVYHADLNAHNILLTEDGGVSIIDFDRARIKDLTAGSSTRWCQDNLNRLQRSVVKILNLDSSDAAVSSGMGILLENWKSSLH